MKCPYCAEEIQDDAVVCRFCFASKQNGAWIHPSAVEAEITQKRQGPRFTMRFAGFFFFLSALAELSDITVAVQLFGEEYTGIIAFIYHIIYIGLYGAMGLGLWSAKPWGFQVLFAGTLTYTVDRLLFIMYGQATSGLISQYGELMGVGGEDIVSQAMHLGIVATLVAWWSFVLYVYIKRDYFVPLTDQ